MNILVPDIAVAEQVLRSAVVYLFLLVAFELVVISNVVQNALIGNDNSLRHARLSLPERPAPLCQQGVISLRDMRSVVLEEEGHLGVISKRPATP